MIAAERQRRSEKEAGNVMATAVAFEHYQNMLRAITVLRSPDAVSVRPSNIRLSRPLDLRWPR
jgi:hypothetical protein